MKHFLLLGCGLGMAALAGCNNTETANSTSASTSGSDPSSRNSSSNSSASGSSDKKYTIAVIPKGTTHAFWKSVEAGANKAGKELNVGITFKGPVQESDRASQIAIVDQFASQGTSAIVLAPLDDAALVKPVKNAFNKKIPVVIIDSALKGTAGTDFTSFVSTDNYKGGVLGGEQLAKDLGGKGKVVLLRYQEGSASTVAREKGFMDAMKKNPGITIISENRYSGATAGEAKSSAINMADKLREANGIFTPN